MVSHNSQNQKKEKRNNIKHKFYNCTQNAIDVCMHVF